MGPHFNPEAVQRARWITKGRLLAAAVAVALFGGAFGVTAANASSRAAAARPIAAYSCENSTRTLKTALTEHTQKCPTGMQEVLIGAGSGARGPQGPVGPKGATGPAGATGTAGAPGETLVSTTVIDPATVPAGGSFSARKLLLKAITVPNGTYRVLITVKAANLAGNTAAIYPLVAVYDGAAKADFSNNLFNAGEGSLPTAVSIDQYVNHEQIVTVTSGELDVYGFGYLDDRSAGTWADEGGTVSITRIAVAS